MKSCQKRANYDAYCLQKNCEQKAAMATCSIQAFK